MIKKKEKVNEVKKEKIAECLNEALTCIENKDLEKAKEVIRDALNRLEMKAQM